MNTTEKFNLEKIYDIYDEYDVVVFEIENDKYKMFKKTINTSTQEILNALIKRRQNFGKIHIMINGEWKLFGQCAVVYIDNYDKNDFIAFKTLIKLNN